MRFLLLFSLISAGAFAQDSALGPTSGGISRGNFLRIPDYRTPGTGLQTYFVATTGSDSNNCQVSGSPCLTIQGALNKVPKLLRDQVTISITAGTYGGFTISGFTYDTSIQTATGGLLIDGALATSTLATGSATGTAAGAGQSAGSGSTFGVLCDSGATWTVNDLRGRFLTTALPTNTALAISSNTATCITVVGLMVLPVAAQTTYTVQDPSVILNTAVSIPANPINAASANRAAIECADNQITYRANAIVIRNLRTSNAAGSGIEISDTSAYRLTNVQLRPSGAAVSGLLIDTLVSTAMDGALSIANSDVSTSSSGAVVIAAGGTFTSAGTLFRNAGSASLGLNLGNTGAVAITIGTSEMLTLGQSAGAAVALQSGSIGDFSSAFTDNRISCAAASASGIFIGPTSITSTITGAGGSLSTITNTNIITCNIGLSVVGPRSNADVTSMTGAAAVTGFSVTLGGLVTFAKAGTTITAGTNEVNLDSGGATAAFADIVAGTCLATAPQSSRVCGR